MSGAGDGSSDPYLDRATLARLVDNLTVEDVRLSQSEYAEGDPMRGFAAVWHAARREMGDAAGDVSAFLARVRLRDLAPLLDEATASGNARTSTADSPPSAASGA